MQIVYVINIIPKTKRILMCRRKSLIEAAWRKDQQKYAYEGIDFMSYPDRKSSLFVLHCLAYLGSRWSIPSEAIFPAEGSWPDDPWILHKLHLVEKIDLPSKLSKGKLISRLISIFFPLIKKSLFQKARRGRIQSRQRLPFLLRRRSNHFHRT